MNFFTGVIALAFVVSAYSFSVGSSNIHDPRSGPGANRKVIEGTSTALRLDSDVGSGSDFGSAMPAKPQQTLAEKLIESATGYLTTIESQLGEGVEPPPEIGALRSARDSGDPKKITSCMYELMIETGMTFDQDPDTGTLTPTEWDIKENLDAEEVKKEFGFLYGYGMKLIKQGLLDIDTAKDIIKRKLIERTGKTPEEFDAWLGY